MLGCRGRGFTPARRDIAQLLYIGIRILKQASLLMDRLALGTDHAHLWIKAQYAQSST
jgi:hypothetical protein